MLLKSGLVLLVLGVVAFGVYSFTSKPNYDAIMEAEQGTIQAKLMSSEVYPKSPFATSTLQIKMANGTRDDYAYMTVSWFRNGMAIPSISGALLESRYFKKGDNVHAEVNLLGSDALPQPVQTRTVKILNSPPTIVSATTSLKQDGGDVLYVRVDAVDPDDENLRYTYKWFRNGSEIKGQTTPALSVEGFALGDRLHAEIIASDGDDTTAPYKADPITLGSNAPSITSAPPHEISPDRRYIYQIEAEAINGSRLAYELVRAPDGMSVSATGLIDWPLPEKEMGARKYDITLRVSDASGGEAFQEFSISLSGSN